MKSKRLVLISIIVAFFLIVLLSSMTLFSVRQAKVNFAVSEDFNTEEVQELLDGYKGKNLMFLKVDKIQAELEKYHYLEVVSIEKDYPNVLKVSLKERREVYCFNSGEQTYVTNEDGFVLSAVQADYVNNNRNVINVNLTGVTITEIKEGAVIATDSPELMTSVFDMAKAANLTDCIKQINVIKKAAGEPGDVEFITYTGVTICVQKAEVDGVEKVNAAFKVYDEKITDYEKAFDKLFVFRNADSGEIQVTWSDNVKVKE